MFYVSLILYVLFVSMSLQAQSKKMQVGVYGLQAPVGSEGFQTGKLDDVSNYVKLLREKKGAKINVAMAMRSWDRSKYPNWDFTRFLGNYLSDMYNLTVDSEKHECIQILSPALYSVFADPPVSIKNSDDKGNNRTLNKELFKKFIWNILDIEAKIVLENSNNISTAVSILLESSKRPLAGWYLDDEPFVRNHDITVIQDMAKIIREIENEYYQTSKIFGNLPNYMQTLYHCNRYIAFDGDDLHQYNKSGRKEDGKNYNYNGRQVLFKENQKYSVLGEDVCEVVMIDFYHPNIRFWGKILSDFYFEFSISKQQTPKVIPIIYADFSRQDSLLFDQKYYNNVIKYLNSFNIYGLWFYYWNSGNNKVVNFKELWFSPKYNIQKILTDNFYE